MGIGLFQLVVPDILADEVVDILLLIPVALALDGADELLDAGLHRLLVGADLPFVEEVLRDQLHAGGLGTEPVGKPGHVEDFRAVQPQLQKDLAQRPPLQPGNGEGGSQSGQPRLHGVVDLLMGAAQPLIVIGLHHRARRSAVRAAISSSVVDQLVQKRTASRCSSTCAHSSKTYFSRSRSICSFLRMGKIWFVGDWA